MLIPVHSHTQITISQVVNRLHNSKKRIKTKDTQDGSKEDTSEVQEVIKIPEPEKKIDPRMVFRELCHKSSQNFSKIQKDLDSLVIINRFHEAKFPEAKPKFKNIKRKKFSLNKMLMKSQTQKNFKNSIIKSNDERLSNQYNPESIISRESTPSEFPLVKNAVKFLLGGDKRTQIKSSSRNIFSPLSLGSPFNKNREVKSPKLEPLNTICTPLRALDVIQSPKRKKEKLKPINKKQPKTVKSHDLDDQNKGCTKLRKPQKLSL
ncbi:unnamed protein product [Moneuplotes crassus]|uniref:Uncharacterized protein n=1 Tax=Euplotes crassus TaxID=5936 RepID=A0AAD1TYH7_EUPCR|nr:unnamed protein product [Moneuplotes crassus]